MLALDERTITELGVSSPVLMERASLGVTHALVERWPDVEAVAVLCGPGNNGADGVVIARQLCQAGLDVTLLYSHAHLNIAAQEQLAIARQLPLTLCDLDTDTPRISAALRSADVWVDALLGVGSTGPPRGIVAKALQLAHNNRSSRTRVIAVDIPSGVETNTGVTHPDALAADTTVTFEHRKPCHLLAPGSELCGSLVVHTIGLLPAPKCSPRWTTEPVVRERWRPLGTAAHKGTRGHLLVIAGAPGTYGAALLCASAALRSGAGLVTIACPSPPPALVAVRPELMWRERSTVLAELTRFEAIVLGPGAGTSEDAAFCFDQWYATEGRPPSVLDADALTWLSNTTRELSDADVLTPHPGELARLLGQTTQSVLADLPAAAASVYQTTGATVVAKTAGAWIHGKQTYCVGAGHSGMGTAGSGDVLAGIIGAMLLRHPALDAALLGTWIHARAGAHAGARSGSESLIASDLIDALPQAFRTLTEAR